MRRLVSFGLVLAVIAAGASWGDVVARHRVQTAIATHLDRDVPGARTSVSISSFPFVGRLAVSGTVPRLRARIDGATVAGLTFSSITIDVHGLQVGRDQLFHRRVVLRDIRDGTVTAVLPESSIDHVTGVAVTLGAGTVGIGGVQLPVRVSVIANRVTLAVPGLPAVSFAVPVSTVLPCVTSGLLQPGQLVLSCAVTSLPPALSAYSASL